MTPSELFLILVAFTLAAAVALGVLICKAL